MNKILSTFIIVLFSTSMFAQNLRVDLLPKNQALPSQTIHKTVMTVNPNGGTQINEAAGERCLQHSVSEQLMETNPAYRQGVEEAREITQQIVREFDSGERAAPPVYTIPVVFHVIHKGEAVGSGTNISTAQVESAIDALNRDYRELSTDGGIGIGAGPDTEIQFCLAGVDPQGNPHSGINRVNGTSVSGYASNGISAGFGGNDEQVKALSNWDNRYYMNVWIVSEINGNGADLSNPNQWTGGTLGYAYIPQNPITALSAIDGIVVVNICLGNDPNGNLGYRLWPFATSNRTLTHEAGHYLGLSHVFSDNNPTSCQDGDGFSDTPNARQTSSNSCNYPNACNNQMIENYMDYTNEFCQNQFTSQQTTYMRGILSGVRNQLVNTSNCGVSTNYDAAITAISTPSGTLCENTFTPVVTLTNFGATTLTSVQIQYYIDSETPTTFSWSGSLASNASTNVTLNSLTTTPGAHAFTARTVSGTLNGSNNDEVTSNDQVTDNFSVSSGGTPVTLTLNVDCWGSEVTWNVKNASGNTVASGGPYTDNSSGEQFIESFCLQEGCYDFTINDSEGDGMYGSQFSCGIDGSYSISDGSSTLIQTLAQNADYGSSETQNFCIGGGGTNPILDCGVLMEFDGAGFTINTNDLPNFDVQLIDNDQEALSTTLSDAGYNSGWMGFYEEVAPLDTNYYVGVASWFVDANAQADNWLTFGPVTMLSDDGELSWKHSYASADFRDGYEVLVGTSGTNISDFNGATVLYSVTDNDPSTVGNTDWTQQTVNLPAGTYANQSLYFAIHHNALDQVLVFFDDVIVEGCNSITVGTEENEAFSLNVFPNPSSQNFTFRYNSNSTEDISFRMLNSVGQEVWSYQSVGQSSGSETIETRGLAAGVYTLVVTSEKLNISERLILTK